jgi:hypothetical protein
MLLVHLVLSIVTETRCSRIPELQKENAAQRHHARTINDTSQQIRILQQLWKDVSKATVVNSPN